MRKAHKIKYSGKIWCAPLRTHHLKTVLWGGFFVFGMMAFFGPRTPRGPQFQVLFATVCVRLFFFKIQRDGIDAKSVMCFCWSVIKKMSQMTATASAKNFVPYHQMRKIFFDSNSIGKNLIKTWPAGGRFKFCIRCKKRIATGCTSINPAFIKNNVFAGIGLFRLLFSKNLILFGR